MSILTKVLNEDHEIDNIVGLALIRQFEERFPDDKDYVSGNANKIKDMDVANCFLQWFQLDQTGQDVFVKHLGMPEDLLIQTCEGIKWVLNKS